MNKTLFIGVLLLSLNTATAQRFEDYFEDRTLRLDYTFSGKAVSSSTYSS